MPDAENLHRPVRHKTRDEWTSVFAGTDPCVTPVLTWAEAAANEHLRARSTLICREGVTQAAPAPRFFPNITGSSRRATIGNHTTH